MKDLNQYIDQTILKPDATRDEILAFLEGVVEHRFYAAVVNPCWVPIVVSTLPEGIKACSVVGFPLGASSTRSKVFAAEDLVQMGCHEIDMVMNIGKLKDKDFKYVSQEIAAVVKACQHRVVKVIIETCLLTQNEKITAAQLIEEQGAHFVKTSTGFSRAGAKVEDVRLLRSKVGGEIGIKASGGIRTYAQAVQFIEAGANRLGTSSGVAIMTEPKHQ